MNYKIIQERLATGGFALSVAFIVATAGWFMPAGMQHISSPHPWGSLSFLSDTLRSALGYALLLLAAILLRTVNARHAIIRIHSTIYISLFLLFATLVQPHTFQSGGVLACSVLGMLLFLFYSYQQSNPVDSVFHGFLCYGVGCLFFPPWLLMLPFLIWMQAGLHGFTLRTFCAVLLGALLPFWFLLGYAAAVGQFSLFTGLCEEAIHFAPIDYTSISLLEWIELGFLTVTAVWSSLCYAGNSYLDKLRTRSCIYYFMELMALVCLFLLLQPQYYDVLIVLVALLSAMLAGHYFAVTRTRGSFVALLVVLASLITFYILTLWIRL